MRTRSSRRARLRWLCPSVVYLATACASSSPAPRASTDEAGDVRAARTLFDKNIEAIQSKNREQYLACYRPSDRLVRTGPGGIKLGFEELATTTPTTASADWPESLEAFDLETKWIAPGVVYGAYRYRVRIKGVTTEGISERVFLKDEQRWVIAVTTAFPVASPEP